MGIGEDLVGVDDGGVDVAVAEEALDFLVVGAAAAGFHEGVAKACAGVAEGVEVGFVGVDAGAAGVFFEDAVGKAVGEGAVGVDAEVRLEVADAVGVEGGKDVVGGGDAGEAAGGVEVCNYAMVAFAEEDAPPGFFAVAFAAVVEPVVAVAVAGGVDVAPLEVEDFGGAAAGDGDGEEEGVVAFAGEVVGVDGGEEVFEFAGGGEGGAAVGGDAGAFDGGEGVGGGGGPEAVGLGKFVEGSDASEFLVDAGVGEFALGGEPGGPVLGEAGVDVPGGDVGAGPAEELFGGDAVGFGGVGGAFGSKGVEPCLDGLGPGGAAVGFDCFVAGGGQLVVVHGSLH